MCERGGVGWFIGGGSVFELMFILYYVLRSCVAQSKNQTWSLILLIMRLTHTLA